jgi:hypothetical protein
VRDDLYDVVFDELCAGAVNTASAFTSTASASTVDKGGGLVGLVDKGEGQWHNLGKYFDQYDLDICGGNAGMNGEYSSCTLSVLIHPTIHCTLHTLQV